MVAVMVRFKGEDGNRIHLIPLANVTSSGIRIRMCLERLATLIKEYGKTNHPAFFDMEGYMLYETAIKIVFHMILEEIHIHRDINLADSMPRYLNVQEHYW